MRDRERFKRVWRRCSQDSVFFCNTFLDKKPHPGQVTWLRNSNQPVNTLVPGNRWGKSTIIAEKHIWKNLFKVGIPPGQKKGADYQTISVAMSADQAEIVFSEAKRLLRQSSLMPFVRSMVSTPFPRIEFTNGSVLHCRSAHDGGKYIDGHAYRYLSIDEAGWLSDLKGLMANVIILRLAGGGDIDLIGTPKGYNDLYHYFERGQRGVPGYYSQRGSIYDNPHLSAEDIAIRDRLLASSNPKLRQQALFGEFVDFSGLAFTRDQRDNAFDGGLPVFQPPVDGHRYIAAWDLGRRTDYTVGIVLDITTRPWVLVSYTRLNKVSWEEIYETIERTRLMYHIRWSTIDATGPGGDVIEEEMFKRGYQVDPIRTETKAAKVDLINTLQNAFDEGRQATGFEVETDESGNTFQIPVLQDPGEGWGLLRLPTITQLMDELGIYALDDKDIPFTDSVISLAMAAKAAYDTEGLSEPIYGGLYSSVDATAPQVVVVKNLAPGQYGEVLGG